MYDANVYSEQRIDLLLASLQHVLTYTQRRGRLSQQGTTMPCKQTRLAHNKSFQSSINLNQSLASTLEFVRRGGRGRKKSPSKSSTQAEQTNSTDRDRDLRKKHAWSRASSRSSLCGVGVPRVSLDASQASMAPSLLLSPLNFLAACCHRTLAMACHEPATSARTKTRRKAWRRASGMGWTLWHCLYVCLHICIAVQPD
jgi:hypothetical protein